MAASDGSIEVDIHVIRRRAAKSPGTVPGNSDRSAFGLQPWITLQSGGKLPRASSNCRWNLPKPMIWPGQSHDDAQTCYALIDVNAASIKLQLDSR